MSKNQNEKIPQLKIEKLSSHLKSPKHNDVTDGNTTFQNRQSLQIDQSAVPGPSPVHTIPATDDIKQILLGLDQQKMMLILNKLNESDDFRHSLKIEGADDDVEYV